MGEFVRLLNDLQVCAKDLDHEYRLGWARLLLDTVGSSEGIQHLSHLYWELLVGLIRKDAKKLFCAFSGLFLRKGRKKVKSMYL